MGFAELLWSTERALPRNQDASHHQQILPSSLSPRQGTSDLEPGKFVSSCKNLVQFFKEAGAALASGLYLYVANYFHFLVKTVRKKQKAFSPFIKKAFFPRIP